MKRDDRVKRFYIVAAWLVSAIASASAAGFVPVAVDFSTVMYAPDDGPAYKTCVASDKTTGTCTKIGDVTFGSLAAEAVNATQPTSWEAIVKAGALADRVRHGKVLTLTEEEVMTIKTGLPTLIARQGAFPLEAAELIKALTTPAPAKP